MAGRSARPLIDARADGVKIYNASRTRTPLFSFLSRRVCRRAAYGAVITSFLLGTSSPVRRAAGGVFGTRPAIVPLVAVVVVIDIVDDVAAVAFYARAAGILRFRRTSEMKGAT